MSVDDQLLYESRTRPRQAVIAAAAGVLILSAAVTGLVGPHAAVNELTLGLLTDHRRTVLDFVSAVLNAGAQVTLAATIFYLFRLARARRSQAPAFMAWLAVIGGAIALVCVLGNAIVLHVKVDDFVDGGARTYDEANHLTGGVLLLAFQVGTQVGSLLMAIAVCLTSLQAMRVGLLPRALGYIGIVAGVLIIIPIIAVPVVQLYWLLALAYLMMGRWPSGLPPAWRSGQAEPWPSGAEMRAQRVAATERRRGGRGRPAAAPAADGPDPSELEPQPVARTRSTTPKRKRKRRS